MYTVSVLNNGFSENFLVYFVWSMGLFGALGGGPG